MIKDGQVAELERLILGIPLVRPETLDVLTRQTRPEDFTHPGHRKVYEVMLALRERGENVNFTTVVDALERKGRLAEVGGLAYLERFLEFPKSLDYRHYLKRFREYAFRRRLDGLFRQYRDAIRDPERTPLEVIRDLEAELARLREEWKPDGQGPRITPVGEWVRIQQEAPTWVVDGLILQGGLTLLIGKPKTGKSTLARAIALAVALGRPILGRSVQKGPVLLMTHHREDPPAAVREHLRKMGVREGDTVPLYIADGVQTLGDIVSWVETNRPALIVIDTIARYAGFEDVNDYVKVLSALEPLQDLARQYGTAVLALHHAPKSGDDRETIDSPLGSTALAGAADIVMRYKRTGDRRILQTVNRFGDDLPETVVTLGPDGWPEAVGSLQEVQAHEEERAILDAIAANGPMTKDELREALGRKAIDLVRTLQALLRQGRIGRTGKGRKGDPYVYFIQNSVPASTDEASGWVDTERSGMAVGETLRERNSVYRDEESDDSVPDSGPLYGNGGNGIFESASEADSEGKIPFPPDGKRISAGSPQENGDTTSPNSVPACSDAISDEFLAEKPDGSKAVRKSDDPPDDPQDPDPPDGDPPSGLTDPGEGEGFDDLTTLWDPLSDSPPLDPGTASQRPVDDTEGRRDTPDYPQAPGPPENGPLREHRRPPGHLSGIDPEAARLCRDCWERGVIKFGYIIGPDGRRRCGECLLKQDPQHLV